MDLTGLRHFKNGISGVSQWTGAEHKEMEKVFLCLIAAKADERVVKAVRALLDFVYLASLQRQTSSTLNAIEHSLSDFHANKQAFIDFAARHPAHFNIPKYHMLEHYVFLLRLLGSADGFNTEWSERLHIDYAKDAYRASNKKDYVIQMTVWLRRQEAVDRFTMYLYWYRNGGFNTTGQDSHLPLADRQAVEPGSVEYFLPLHPKAQKLNTPNDIDPLIPHILYHVPKNHPPLLRAVPASKIIAENGASRFLPTVQTFLRNHDCLLVPHEFDEFKLFKKVNLMLPPIPEVSKKKYRDIVRASPPVPPAGRAKGEPAHLDFAFVRTGEANLHTDGTNLEGMSQLLHLVTDATTPMVIGL